MDSASPARPPLAWSAHPWSVQRLGAILDSPEFALFATHWTRQPVEAGRLLLRLLRPQAGAPESGCLPAFPPLHWTAAEWSAQSVETILDSAEFARFSAAWAREQGGLTAELISVICRQARVPVLSVAALPALEQAVRELVAVGGHASGQEVAFHLNFALAFGCSLLGPSVAGRPRDKTRLLEVLGRATLAAFRAAVVAISGRLQSEPGLAPSLGNLVPWPSEERAALRGELAAVA